MLSLPSCSKIVVIIIFFSINKFLLCNDLSPLGLSNKTSGLECKCAKYGNQWDVVVLVIYDMVIVVAQVPIPDSYVATCGS